MSKLRDNFRPKKLLHKFPQKKITEVFRLLKKLSIDGVQGACRVLSAPFSTRGPFEDIDAKGYLFQEKYDQHLIFVVGLYTRSQAGGPNDPHAASRGTNYKTIMIRV